MPAREHILHRVRTAVGRSTGQPPAEPPPAWLRAPEMGPEERIHQMLAHFPGNSLRAGSREEARAYLERLARGRRSVASPNPLLDELGLFGIREVQRLSGGVEAVRAACAEAEIGITGAEYGLADTGALVVTATREESRLASLLPAVHAAVLPAGRILSSLDELFTVLPDPSAISASLVLIGGPSKTADIEQILTLGVHGPREIHLVVADFGS
jgi:L-lactate dehydrogenase complex protein LldG